MPKPSASQVLTEGHLRNYYQLGGEAGAGPDNDMFFGGIDTSYFRIDTASNPRRGDVSGIFTHDPLRPKNFVQVGESVSAPDAPTASISFKHRHKNIPRHLYDMGDCPVTFYQVAGYCKDLSDFLNGWTDWVRIYSNGIMSSVEEMGQGAFDSDDALIDDTDWTFETVYMIGQMQFTERAGATITREVIDVAYGQPDSCSLCRQGTEVLYAVMKNDEAVSPAVAMRLLYSRDGGITWTAALVTGSISTETPTAIEVVGGKLIITYINVSSADGGYFLGTIDPATGIPSAWSNVNTGFVAGAGPYDVYAPSQRAVFFAGANGYIYKSENLLQGVSIALQGATGTSDLRRIHGAYDTVVAVGEAGTVFVSGNLGKSFAAATAAGVAQLQALAVLSETRFWAGDQSGDIYYTQDGGLTWASTSAGVASSPAAPDPISAIQDIAFINDEVGFILYAVSGPTAGIRWTVNGGHDWGGGAPRLTNVPTADRFNRMAFPAVSNMAVAANNMLVGGLAGDGADGLIAIALPQVA